MTKRVLVLFSVMAVGMMLAAACGGGGEESAPTSTNPRPTATTPARPTQAPTQLALVGGYQETTVTNGGTIAGIVSFSGTPPEPQTLEVDKDVEVCGTSKPGEVLLASSGGGIKNAVVSIKDIARGKAMDVAATAALGQAKCLYGPHVLIGRVGGSLQVTNGDPLMHNVHSFPFDNASINRAQPQGSAPITVSLEFPEVYQIGCDIHKWMSAWMVVTEHPYYAISGADGSFSLTDVPPGTYQVEVWHEKLGTSTQTVTVAAGETAQASFALAPR